MSGQYPYGESGSYFHVGDGEHIINIEDAGIPGNSHSEAENESAYFTHSSNMSGQISSLGDNPFFTEDNPFFTGDDSFFTGNDGHHLVHNPDAGIPGFTPEYLSSFSMDFSKSDLIPHPEDNSFFTRYFGDPSYDISAAATPNLGEYDETSYWTDFSNPDQTPHFGDGSSFSGGAGERFSDASGAEILDDATYNAKAPLNSDMMPQSAVVPESGCNRQEAPQPGDDNIRSSDPNQSNESPSQPHKTPRWTEEDELNLLTWYDNGVCFEKIGEKLHRTAMSCKLHRQILIRKALAPKDVPILPLKDMSRLSWEMPDQKAMDCVDWATPILMDKSLVDWNTPGLKDWVHDQLKKVRKVQNGGPGMKAWQTVAEQLNKKNKTNLVGKDLLANLPYR